MKVAPAVHVGAQGAGHGSAAAAGAHAACTQDLMFYAWPGAPFKSHPYVLSWLCLPPFSPVVESWIPGKGRWEPGQIGEFFRGLLLVMLVISSCGSISIEYLSSPQCIPTPTLEILFISYGQCISFIYSPVAHFPSIMHYFIQSPLQDCKLLGAEAQPYWSIYVSEYLILLYTK